MTKKCKPCEVWRGRIEKQDFRLILVATGAATVELAVEVLTEDALGAERWSDHTDDVGDNFDAVLKLALLSLARECGKVPA